MVTLRRRAKERQSALPEEVRMLAVLLQAGAVPLAAWRHLAESGVPAAAGVVVAVERGASVADAIRERGGVWCEVAAAWAVASTVGAPMGDVLRVVADALDDALSTADEVRVALAEPSGTARLLLWLPGVGVLLGTALGFDTLPVLFGHPLGLVCLAAGLGLTLLARLWTAALVRRAQPRPGIPGMHAELLAVALSGGASIPRATALVAEESDAAVAAGSSSGGRSGHAGDHGHEAETSLDRVLRLSARAGVPAVDLLRAEAARARRAERVRGRLGAARLSTRLLLPLGACTLPAFLLLGVAPLALSVLSTTPLPGGL